MTIPVQAGTLYTDVTMVHDGLTRTYNYFIPSNLPASPVPLLFYLHGGGGNADLALGLKGNKAPSKVYVDIAEQEKFIYVVPDGHVPDPSKPDELHWNDLRTDATNHNNSVDDVGYIEALITHFSSNYNIDSQRIYCTGISNGGFMSLTLAMNLSHKIAAVAPICAVNARNSSAASPVNPIPVMLIAGTADELVPWNGGYGKYPEAGYFESIPDTVAFWVNHNGADTVPEITEIPDGPYDDYGTMVMVYTYDNGVEGTEVLLYKVNGGGHAEPSIKEQHSTSWETIVGYQNHDIETAEEVWKFFKKHALNGPTTSPPVGGIWAPVNKLQLLAPYIGLIILPAVAVITVGYVKKRKRKTTNTHIRLNHISPFLWKYGCPTGKPRFAQGFPPETIWVQ